MIRRATNQFFTVSWGRRPFVSRRFFISLSLIVAIVLSAFAVIYCQDIHRRLLINKQHLEANLHQLEIERGKLLLEQGTLANQSRLQQLAEKLGMHAPLPSDIILLRVKSAL